MDQIGLFTDNPEYEAFVAKFEPKKTTDDCYTPPAVYETVRDWACREYGIDPQKIVRPFFPGGDFENYPYEPDSTVLDNPPFSILARIVDFYIERGISFFLFSPSLTAFSGRRNVMRCNHVVCDCDIVYDNGAVVRTSFVTSYGGDTVAQSEPELTRIVNETVDRLRRETTKQLPKYAYPPHILTAAMLQRYSKYGIEFRVRRGDCQPIYSLDAQRETGKSIYGGGLLLSQRAAAERAAAERAAAERAAAERAAAERAAAHQWELSQREREIVVSLGRTEGGAHRGRVSRPSPLPAGAEKDEPKSAGGVLRPE